MYEWIVYIHVLATFTFLMTHGVSSFVALRLRSKPDPVTARAWLGLYSHTLYIGLFYGSLGVLLITGIIAAFKGHHWGRGWVWLSLGLLVGIMTAMFYLGTNRYGEIRAALATTQTDNREDQSPEMEEPREDVEELLANSPVVSLAVIGFGGIAVILWLMMFKPF